VFGVLVFSFACLKPGTHLRYVTKIQCEKLTLCVVHDFIVEIGLAIYLKAEIELRTKKT